MKKINLYVASAIILSMCSSIAPAAAENSEMVSLHGEGSSVFQESVKPFGDVADGVAPTINSVFDGMDWGQSSGQKGAGTLLVQGGYDDDGGFSLTFTYDVEVNPVMYVSKTNPRHYIIYPFGDISGEMQNLTDFFSKQD